MGVRFKSNKDSMDLQLVLLFISIDTTNTSDVRAGEMSNPKKGVTNGLIWCEELQISSVTERAVSIWSNRVINLLGHDGRKATFLQSSPFLS